jgi:hypothetical protein
VPFRAPLRAWPSSAVHKKGRKCDLATAFFNVPKAIQEHQTRQNSTTNYGWCQALFGVFLMPAVQPKHPELGPNQSCFRLEQRYAKSASHASNRPVQLYPRTASSSSRPRMPQHCHSDQSKPPLLLLLRFCEGVGLRSGNRSSPCLPSLMDSRESSATFTGRTWRPRRTLTASSPAALAQHYTFP